jgi:hypothetical protein
LLGRQREIDCHAKERRGPARRQRRRDNRIVAVRRLDRNLRGADARDGLVERLDLLRPRFGFTAM